MKELAEALKTRSGLRMRQGVVTAVTGSTNSVLIGGSDVAVDGVQHLNSCAPAVDDVVWIASDGADLWIIGTHGDPPPIDASRLPAFETYFTDADPAGVPNPVTGLAGAAGATGVLLTWDLPAEAKWRTWAIYQGTATGFTPGVPILVTGVTAAAIPLDPGSGPWYFKVRAINTRDEVSTDVEAGPFTVSDVTISDGSISTVKIADLAIETPKLAANAVTAAKINVADVQAAVVTADVVNALALNAGSITAGTLATARLNTSEIQAAVVTAAAINALELNAVSITGGSINGVSITGQTITGGTLQTDSSGARFVLASRGGLHPTYANIEAWTDGANEVYPASILISDGDGSYGLFQINGPLYDAIGVRPYVQLVSSTDNGTQIKIDADSVVVEGPLTVRKLQPSYAAAITHYHEFFAPAAAYNNGAVIDPWYCVVSSGVTTSTGNDGTAHPGTLTVTTPATALTGATIRTGWQTMVLQTGDWCEFVFKTPTVTNPRIRLGFMNSGNLFGANSEAAGDYGAFFDVSAGNGIRGEVVINGTKYYTSATLSSLSVGAWYTGRIEIGAGECIFYLWDASSNAIIAGESINVGLAGVTSFGHGFAAWCQTASAKNILEIDYMSFYLAPRSR